MVLVASGVWVAAFRVAVLVVVAATALLFGFTPALASPHEIYLPRTEGTSTTGAIYNRLANDLFRKHPDQWGDAFVEGEVVVINTVTRSPEDAAKLLKKMGITGGIVVREGDWSIAELERAMKYLHESGELPESVTMWGPDYIANGLVVGVEPSAWGVVSEGDIAAILRTAPWAEELGVPPISVVPEPGASFGTPELTVPIGR